MVIDSEDELSLEEIIKICNSIKKQNIEIISDPILRPKNHEFMTRYELLDDDIRDIIKKLNKEDYHQGPVEDKKIGMKHPFWIFIKYENKIRVKIYIKIKIINKRTKIIVFSIHEEGKHND